MTDRWGDGNDDDGGAPRMPPKSKNRVVETCLTFSLSDDGPKVGWEGITEGKEQNV